MAEDFELNVFWFRMFRVAPDEESKASEPTQPAPTRSSVRSSLFTRNRPRFNLQRGREEEAEVQDQREDAIKGDKAAPSTKSPVSRNFANRSRDRFKNLISSRNPPTTTQSPTTQTSLDLDSSQDKE